MNSNVPETLCILLNMQNVSWHPRIHSDKPLYSSSLTSHFIFREQVLRYSLNASNKGQCLLIWFFSGGGSVKKENTVQKSNQKWKHV